MTDVADAYSRWRRLAPEERARVRQQEKIGSIISRLKGWSVIDQPGCGYWVMRAVKGGPEVPASIQWERTEHEPGIPDNLMDRSPILTARIAGSVVEWGRVWNWTKREVTKEEHDFRLADMAWAKANRPNLPIANPRKKLDLMQAEIPF